MEHYVYHISKDGMSLDEGYIGITNNPEYRWKQHCRSKYIVGSAIRKHKLTFTDNFKILVKCDRQYALSLEQRLRPNSEIGWNIKSGGENGSEHSEETKKKIGDILRGRKQTEEFVEAMRQRMLGNKRSEETKKKIGDAHRGRKQTEEQKSNRRQRMLGHEVTKETRDKLSKHNKGRPWNAKRREACDNRSTNNSNKGKPWSVTRRLAQLKVVCRKSLTVREFIQN